MIDELKTLVESTTVNEQPLYPVEYEEVRMMNLKADEKGLDARFAYIEEFVQGGYTRDKYQWQKVTQVQIYFCRFTDLNSTAIERESIRSQIESEIAIPFMQKYNALGVFDWVDSFKFFTPPPRFDANEVSVMLQFNCSKDICI